MPNPDPTHPTPCPRCGLPQKPGGAHECPVGERLEEERRERAVWEREQDATDALLLAARNFAAAWDAEGDAHGGTMAELDRAINGTELTVDRLKEAAVGWAAAMGGADATRLKATLDLLLDAERAARQAAEGREARLREALEFYTDRRELEDFIELEDDLRTITGAHLHPDITKRAREALGEEARPDDAD